MSIAQESPDQPDVIALITELDTYQDTLYPPEARYALDLASLMQAHVTFVVARDDEGRAVGCGAAVLGDRFGELKRMYVRPEVRGSGVAQSVLDMLERAALTAGCTELLLETGPYQLQAIAFYEKQGYRRRGAFADYPEHPMSVFMGKPL